MRDEQVNYTHALDEIFGPLEFGVSPIAALRAENKELRAEVERLKAEVAMLTTKRTRLINVADDISRRLVSEMAENERLKAELDELKAEHDVAFDRALAKTREAHDLRVEIERLKAERDDALDQVNLLNDYVTKLRAACGGLSPEAVEWAVRIARRAFIWDDHMDMPIRQTARRYLTNEIDACPPEVRAQILQQGREQT